MASHNSANTAIISSPETAFAEAFRILRLVAAQANLFLEVVGKRDKREAMIRIPTFGSWGQLAPATLTRDTRRLAASPKAPPLELVDIHIMAYS